VRAVRAWPRRRPTLAAALIYALLALAFVSPALFPGRVMSYSDLLWFEPPWQADVPRGLERPANPEVGDAPSVMYPLVRFTKDELPDLPLWNPHIAAGRPLLGNMQSQVFSPYSVPAYLLPFYESLELQLALKLFVACLGAFLLARSLGMRFGGALLAGSVYGFNLWIVTWLVYPHASVWTLIPWLLWLTDRLIRRPDGLSLAALAAAVGVQFLAGHPESSFHALVATVAFLVLRLFQLRRESRTEPLARPLFLFGGALASGAALAAVVLVPFLELLFHSADLEQRAGSSVDVHMPARYLLGAFLPDYWGRPTGTPIVFFLLARAYYAGALPLMLACAALILRPRLERVAVAAFGAVCMAVVVGVPPFLQIVTRLPVFSSGHNTRLVAPAMLCLALLAGWGLDELVERREPWRRRRRWVAGAAAVLLVAPLAAVAAARDVGLHRLRDAFEVAYLMATPPAGGEPFAWDVIRLASVFVWLLFAGGALALLLLRARGRLPAAVFVALALVLTVGDLFRAGLGYNPVIDERHARQPATGAVRYLQSRSPARYVATGLVPQNVISMRFGLYEARGYDLPVERRFDRLWRRHVNAVFESQVDENPLAIPLSLLDVTRDNLRVLGLLGVTDLLQPRREDPLRLPGLRLAYDGPDAHVYAYDRALPRAFVVGAQRVVESEDDALAAVTAPGFDARRTVVVEKRVEGLPEGEAAPAGAARLAQLQRERVSVTASARRPGLLVLSDVHYPGWRAEVDGEPADIERVDYLFRGVRLPAGRHQVEFRYEPLSWRIGWIVSLLALVGLVVAVLAGRRARRRGTTGPAPPSHTRTEVPTAPARSP
jgi:hypothetical protein